MPNDFTLEMDALTLPSSGGQPVDVNYSPQVITLSDVVSALLDRSMAPEGDTRTVRLLTSAVQQAMRDLPKKGKWKYYNQTLRFRSSAPVTATVSYAESTRVMTITDGVNSWPTDATMGDVVIGNTPYRITTRTSNTQITLSTDSTIGADYTGEVQWLRSRYRFPRLFSKVHSLLNLSNRTPMAYLEVPQFYERMRLARYSGIPAIYTMTSSNIAGYTDIELSPSGDVPTLFEGLVTVQPVVPKVYQVKGEGGAIASGATTFSGAGFHADCAGSVLRLYSTLSDVPYGRPKFESFVKSITNSTQLELVTPSPTTESNVVYVVSSYMDIDPSLMNTLVEDLAYAIYCQNHDHKGLAQANALAKSSLIEALAADTKLNHSTSRDFAWQLYMLSPTEYAQVQFN